MADSSLTENQERNRSSEFDQRAPADDIITVVLTADNHLGYAAPGQQPRKREEYREQLRHAFQMATDFAVSQGVDLFISAGDLFDTVHPDEQDRSFVAERLALLRQAGVRTFALGGVHDTPVDTYSGRDTSSPYKAFAPQVSYARLGALHYFAPQGKGATTRLPIEPVVIDVHGVCVGICGLGILAGQEGDPLSHLRVVDDIERAAIRLLILHAPVEGLSPGANPLEVRAQVSRSGIANQTTFQHILAGYHHGYRRLRIGHCNVVVAGATQRIDFSGPTDEPGFVFLGIAADGIRWCNHILVDSLPLRRLVINTRELWPDGTSHDKSGTYYVLERLRPLCHARALVQLRLEGNLTREQYHRLDLNQVRRYGEEHCFAFNIDESVLSLLSEQSPESEVGEDGMGPQDAGAGDHGSEAGNTHSVHLSPQNVGRFAPSRISLHEELTALAEEWITAEPDGQKKKALQATKEELLAALEDGKGRRFI